MTVYGDVDVSVIDELPPGRQPIQTLVHGESKRWRSLALSSANYKGAPSLYCISTRRRIEKLDLLAEKATNYWRALRWVQSGTGSRKDEAR